MLSDYQEFDGIKFPTKRTNNLGLQIIEAKLLEAVINFGPTEADLE